jgi:lysophospholipase L1-like esterase
MTGRAAVVLAAACLACTADGVRNARPRGSRIVAFGDSLTAGYRVGPEETYPARLAAILGKPVLNRGVSGETTAESLARLDRDVLAADPRVVLVCLGANDVLRGLPPEAQLAALRRVVEGIQARGALVVLIGTEGYPPVRPFDYAGAYRRLARETGAVYVPDLTRGVLGHGDLMHDGIHPNARGNEAIARRIADEAGEYLSR